MKTNKITATIVIEIEDNRSLESKCWCPMTKERILQDIHIGDSDYFISKETRISFEETNPLTDSDIRIYQDMSAIDDALCKLYDDYNNAMRPQRGYCEIPCLYDYIDKWNWRQDCSN